MNSGLKKDFSRAHWNLNITAAQNFVKLSQLEAYNTMHSYDLICLPETWLDATTSIDSNDLSLKGYNLHHVDDPNNVKKGVVCVYHKETLAVHFLQTKLDQCIVSEVTFKNKKKGHVISLYRSPSPTPDQFANFLQLFEELLQLKSSFVLINSDFNCKNSKWDLGDPVTPQGARVEALTSFYGLNQLIKTPTHLFQNSALCIDLVFTNQAHLVMESGVHSSLSSTCRNEIVFAKLNQKAKYPPPYERVFWDYSRADKASIKRAINAIDWEELFANKTVEFQVSELNDLHFLIFIQTIFQTKLFCVMKNILHG